MKRKIFFLVIGLIIFIGIIIFNLRLTKEISIFFPERPSKPEELEEISPKVEEPIPPIIIEEDFPLELPKPPEEFIPEMDPETTSAIEKEIEERIKEEKEEFLWIRPSPEELQELKKEGAVIY